MAILTRTDYIVMRNSALNKEELTYDKYCKDFEVIKEVGDEPLDKDAFEGKIKMHYKSIKVVCDFYNIYWRTPTHAEFVALGGEKNEAGYRKLIGLIEMTNGNRNSNTYDVEVSRRNKAGERVWEQWFRGTLKDVTEALRIEEGIVKSSYQDGTIINTNKNHYRVKKVGVNL